MPNIPEVRRNRAWNLRMEYSFDPMHPEYTAAPRNVFSYAYLKYFSDEVEQLEKVSETKERAEELQYEPA